MSIAHQLEHPRKPFKRRQRTDTPGLPGSRSWDRLDWCEDDWAWYVVQLHPGGLTNTQVAAVMGLSRSRVEQIEKAATQKLRDGLSAILPGRRPGDVTPEWIERVLERYDEWRRRELYERWRHEENAT